MDYEVVRYGDAVLRSKAEPVREINEDIRQLASDMLRTMYRSQGLGLAAEQVGRRESLCVIDIPPSNDVDEENGPRLNPDIPMPLVLINPRIVEQDGIQEGQEGCLSFPEIYVTVKRARAATVTFLDLEGREQTVRTVGLLARAVQHELDHLDGVLLVDRMSPVQKVALAGRLKRLRRQTKAGA